MLVERSRASHNAEVRPDLVELRLNQVTVAVCHSLAEGLTVDDLHVCVCMSACNTCMHACMGLLWDSGVDDAALHCVQVHMYVRMYVRGSSWAQ
jgi:hypothetical protein